MSMGEAPDLDDGKFWLDSIKEFTSASEWFFNESTPPIAVEKFSVLRSATNLMNHAVEILAGKSCRIRWCGERG